MFLKEKRDSSVKARMCADGRKQKDGTWLKQETTLPTVVTESVFITVVIDAHEGDDVACFNILGAFLGRGRPYSTSRCRKLCMGS